MTNLDELEAAAVAWRFPFDSYHTAFTSDPEEAGRYRDVEPLYSEATVLSLIAEVRKVHRLLNSCREAMQVSQDSVSGTDWRHMLAAIDAALPVGDTNV